MNELWDWVTSGWDKTTQEWGDLFSGDFYGAFGGAEDASGDPVPGYSPNVANGSGSGSASTSKIGEELIVGAFAAVVLLVLVLLILGKIEAL